MPDQVAWEKQQGPVQAKVPESGTACPAGGLSPDGDLCEGNTDFPTKISERREQAGADSQVNTPVQYQGYPTNVSDVSLNQ